MSDLPEREVQLEGGPRHGLRIKTSTRDSIEVAFIDDEHAVRCDPNAPKPFTQIKTIRYRSIYDYDEGREIYRPDWATLKTYDCNP